MLRFIANRGLQSIIVLFLVTVIVFALMRILPGDPVAIIAGTGVEGLTAEEEAQLRARFGLDQPLPMQYINWIGNVLVGDWGTSTRTGAPVWSELTHRAPITAQLALTAWAIAVLVGVTTGVAAAIHRRTPIDSFSTAFAMFGISMPDFWLGILLILVFSVWMGLLPSVGFVSPATDLLLNLKHLLLPALALGLSEAAVFMRQTRSGMLEVLGQDFIRVARAKGTPERVIIWHHTLKNAALPIVTIMGLRFGRLIGGTVVIESIFGLPGLGRLAVQSIVMRDYLALQGVVLLVALFVVIINLITDIIYAVLDPRIRLA